MASSVYKMRVRFETSLARSKDYVPIRNRSYMKVESEKDYETYRESNAEFPSRPASYVSFSTNISMPVSYRNSLTSHATSHANSRPGSYQFLNNLPARLNSDSHSDFPSVSRPSSYVHPGNNPPRFDPEPTRVNFTKHAISKLPSISSIGTSSSQILMYKE
ncbi:uncharacterized protein LOC130051720 [Ostrea edulis]|uniref:uncharacterized protein LOC130051720 n=1 Tax=Ostrea edulis TaxID=37623 RepID=UPI0024AFCE1F|nr:uncharacterized protein LOC130051720 [Ostrea edulis]